MKNLKRILAAAGAVLLVGLYLATLVFALMGKDFFPMFMAAIFATITLPVLLWVYSWIYKKTKDAASKKNGSE